MNDKSLEEGRRRRRRRRVRVLITRIPTRNRNPIIEINFSLLTFIMQEMHLYLLIIMQLIIENVRHSDKVEVEA